MDLTVISTFRCNSRCQMCYIWKNPTEPKDEVSIETLSKLPGGFDNLNLSGGEPTLRKDLPELVDELYPKARIMEISSNGLHPERLVPIIKRYPDIKVRFSVEGDEATSNAIRGEKDGFQTKLAGIRMLREAGGTDLGFAMVIQDENAEQLVKVYEMARREGVELATSTLHNAWQFYKNDNYFYNRTRVAKEVEALITAMLRTNKIKNWFRAYLNLGLIEKILGHDRLIPCTAGRDFAFVDPWSDVWACNVRSDLPLGNLARQGWDEIMNSDQTRASLKKVDACTQNCWMVTTARTAMRSRLAPQLPKFSPLAWVVMNKLRVSLGKNVDFAAYINYREVKESPLVPRKSFLGQKVKNEIVVQRGLVTPAQHYPLAEFVNR
ncbi:radical SAM protein [Thiocystis violacea]|uniref:radical SAM protein n=1 Tax=Thiocystis violacea TaxID=13725 RepID=UPI0019074FE6|nr:radical SAM protein [Thiocystis violacea]MBK1717893.1 radical SAM protein [Thiocystis violacea]